MVDPILATPQLIINLNKSFPENSIIFTNEDPNDFYVFSKDLDSNVEFSNFNEYKEIYASRKKEAAFIF